VAIGLLTLADCEGRVRWVPMQVHSQVFPWEASVCIETLLGELIDVSYVVHYEADGKRYIEIPNFRKHQRLSGKEAGYKSLLPAPPEIPKKPKHLRVKTSEANGKHSGASLGSVGNPLGTGEHRNIGTGEHRNIGTDISSEPAIANSKPEDSKFPVFPTSGKDKTWQAAQVMLTEWQAAYPGIDVNEQHRRAHAWVIANIDKRKTAKGMPAFLNRWFANQQDKTSGNGQQKTFAQMRVDNSKAAIDRFSKMDIGSLGRAIAND